MANHIWVGNAPAVPQVNTHTPVAANNAVYTMTRNGKSISYTADASATVAEITAGILLAWEASTEGEFTELTFEDTGLLVQVTGPADGKPFTLTSSSTAGSFTAATPTAGSGPNYANVAANWSGGVPVDAGDVIIDNTDVSILYGLTLSSVTPATLRVGPEYSGQIGLPTRNELGYAEDLPTYLHFDGVTLCEIDAPNCPGIRLNLDDIQSAVTVYRMGSGTFDPPLQLLGTHASNALTVLSGTVGVAVGAGEISTFTTAKVGGSGQEGDAPNVTLGRGVTFATLTQWSGEVFLYCNATTATVKDGTLTTMSAAAIATLTVDGGRVAWNSSGGISTALFVGGGAEADFRPHPGAKTIAACTVYAGARLFAPSLYVTFSAGIVFSRAGLHSDERDDGAMIDLGENFTLTPS